MTDKLAMFIPLVKVDEKKREVWGTATHEIPDGRDEILDYASSVPYFKQWSDVVSKRSKGKSMGNLRAMHQPIAAGKLIAMNFDDPQKKIDIGTFISDDNEWRKVLDGTYTGFSIGGDYVKRWMDSQFPGKTRYTANPHEISLVDAPAVSTATFELIRTDGASELRKFASASPIIEVVLDKADGEVSPLEDVEGIAKSHLLEPGVQAEDVVIEQGETDGALPVEEKEIEEILGKEQVSEITNTGNFVPDVALDGKVHEINTDDNVIDPVGLEKNDLVPDWVADFKATAARLNENIVKLENIRKQEVDEKEKVTAVLKLRSSRVGIARREGEPLAAPKDFPTDWTVYGDPVNWIFPVAKGFAYAALTNYNLQKGILSYTPREWNIIGRRVARLASDEFGVTYKFDPIAKKVERIKQETKNMTTLNKNGNAFDLLREAKAQVNAAVDMVGTDPAAAKDLLMQVMAAMDVVDVTSPASPDSGSPPSLGSAGVSVANAIPAGELSAALPVVEKDVQPASDLDAFGKMLAPLFDLFKTQGDAMTAMQGSIDEIKKAQDNPFVLPPAGDLAGILKDMSEDENPLLKAMNEGDLQKAFGVVGNDPSKLYEQVNDLAIKQLALAGINVAKFGFFPSEEPILGA